MSEVASRAPAAGAPAALAPSRIAPADLLRVGTAGLRTRRMRTLLTAIGIGIGIAAMVAVLGISESSQAGLLSELDQLGTNLLTVSPGQKLFGGAATLPLTAPAMIARVGPVQAEAQTAPVSANVFKTDQIPSIETGGLSVLAASTDLVTTLRGALAAGVFLNGANARYPAVVLGAQTAQYLGITGVYPSVEIQLGGYWFTVVGILQPVALAPELDRTALIGFPVAESLFGIDGSAGTIYVRTDPTQVTNVAQVLAGTANPQNPNEVQVTRPSDVLAARAAAAGAFTALFLGLAAVALVVAGVGIANVMLMSVLERRSEIGLRRALGATRTHIALQFLAEALVLAVAGGILGVLAGVGAAAAYASTQHWQIVLPLDATAGGLAAALAVGAIAGLYPAARAARVSPTEALRTT
ncbi:MAG: ABC transporter permease [Candidatus Limnocylindrales bacterium]